MRYVLTGFFAQHFRKTGNRWQTRAEILAATGNNSGSLTKALYNAKKGKLIESRGDPYQPQYRFRGDALYEERVAPGKKTVSQVTREFCNRWKVEVPSDATHHNPRAFDEWLQVMAERV